VDLLETPRLLLRPFGPGDAEIVHRVYSDPDVMRYVATGPMASLAVTERLLQDYDSHQRRHGYSFWAVIERASGDLIGDSGLYRTPTGEIELGYTLGAAWWGRGYATEAARAAMDWAFRERDFDRLLSLIDPDNAASIRVAERLGETLLGETQLWEHTVLMYGIDRSTWEAGTARR
jgi:[ribosomal protein S5]-alanine N-acetyltransferase